MSLLEGYRLSAQVRKDNSKNTKAKTPNVICVKGVVYALNKIWHSRIQQTLKEDQRVYSMHCDKTKQKTKMWKLVWINTYTNNYTFKRHHHCHHQCNVSNDNFYFILFKFLLFLITRMLWWPIYMIMNSSSFINTNPINSQRDFLPAVKPDSFRTDTSTCCTNTLILYICSVFQYTCTFSPSVSSFWAPNRLQQSGGRKVLSLTRGEQPKVSKHTCNSTCSFLTHTFSSFLKSFKTNFKISHTVLGWVENFSVSAHV